MLEEYIAQFKGCVIVVSHDRYFMKKTATRLLLIERDVVKLYPFGYEQYKEEQDKLRALAEKSGTGGEGAQVALSGNVISVDINQNESIKRNGKSGHGGEEENQKVDIKKAQLSYEEGKAASKREKKLKKLEDKITELEAEIDQKKSELEKPEYASDFETLTAIQNEIDQMEAQLLKTLEEWERL